MKEIPFVKMVASGNDFVVVDNRCGIVKDPLRFARRVCERHRGIGADGVLLFESSRKAKFKMRIINSDGSEAEACGNGFRCLALYAREKMGVPSDFKFETLSGLVRARVSGKKIKVCLPAPKDYRPQREIAVLGHRLHYSFINTGVPHVVIFVEGLDKIDAAKLGQAIRQHAMFRPKGTNVNFAEVTGSQEVRIRTYERGVEGETLACGTGAAASAMISVLAGYTRAPVRVKTAGGEILTIDFKHRGNKMANVTLTGEAHFVCEGRLSDEL